MKVVKETTRLNVLRLSLWLLNLPVGLAAFLIGSYAWVGLWNPQTPLALWLIAGAQPLVAIVSWLASLAAQSEGYGMRANILLFMPMISLVSWFFVMQIWLGSQ